MSSTATRRPRAAAKPSTEPPKERRAKAKSAPRVGFVSLVVPSRRLPRRWTLAGFRHELVRVDQAFSSNGVFQQDPTEFTSRRDAPQEGHRKISLTNYGLAGALYVNSRTSVGASLSVYHFSLDSLFRRFQTEGFLGPPVFTAERGPSSQKGSGVSVAPALGVQLLRRTTRQTSTTDAGLAYFERCRAIARDWLRSRAPPSCGRR